MHCTDVEMRVRLVDADYERIRKLCCPRANTKSRSTRSFNPTRGDVFFFSEGKASRGTTVCHETTEIKELSRLTS